MDPGTKCLTSHGIQIKNGANSYLVPNSFLSYVKIHSNTRKEKIPPSPISKYIKYKHLWNLYSFCHQSYQHIHSAVYTQVKWRNILYPTLVCLHYAWLTMLWNTLLQIFTTFFSLLCLSKKKTDFKHSLRMFAFILVVWMGSKCPQSK